jgi:hypothetical protein
MLPQPAFKLEMHCAARWVRRGGPNKPCMLLCFVLCFSYLCLKSVEKTTVVPNATNTMPDRFCSRVWKSTKFRKYLYFGSKFSWVLVGSYSPHMGTVVCLVGANHFDQPKCHQHDAINRLNWIQQHHCKAGWQRCALCALPNSPGYIMTRAHSYWC